MHRNTKGESPCVADVKNCVRKTLECMQFTVPCNAFTSSLRLVAASLKICYEMCQTSTSQGLCPLQIISNTMVSTCMHVMLVVMLFIT